MNRLFLNVIREGQINGMALGELRGGVSAGSCTCDNNSTYNVRREELEKNTDDCVCDNNSTLNVRP